MIMHVISIFCGLSCTCVVFQYNYSAKENKETRAILKASVGVKWNDMLKELHKLYIDDKRPTNLKVSPCMSWHTEILPFSIQLEKSTTSMLAIQIFTLLLESKFSMRKIGRGTSNQLSKRQCIPSK